MIIQNNFENLFSICLIIGGLIWTIAIFHGPKNDLAVRAVLLNLGIAIMTIGFVIAYISNNTSEIAKLPVPKETIWLMIFWLAAIIGVSFQLMKEHEEQGCGNLAKLPKIGTFIAESDSAQFNGSNRIWLRRPPEDKGTEKVYELPRNLLIKAGKTILVEDGKIEIME